AVGTVVCTINVPNTGGAQNWVTVPATAILTAGAQTLTVSSTATSGKINWFTLSK
ncbi:MAG: carbohydrate-binding protein, partial [Clostridiaceae bacterium]|nr:carbohydrate-binding protein [Clostridiaceae bacterium]